MVLMKWYNHAHIPSSANEEGFIIIPTKFFN
jgi:hypothetical protein